MPDTDTGTKAMGVGGCDSAGMEESAWNTLWMLKQKSLATGNVNTGDVPRKSN